MNIDEHRWGHVSRVTHHITVLPAPTETPVFVGFFSFRFVSFPFLYLNSRPTLIRFKYWSVEDQRRSTPAGVALEDEVSDKDNNEDQDQDQDEHNEDEQEDEDNENKQEDQGNNEDQDQDEDESEDEREDEDNKNENDGNDAGMFSFSLDFLILIVLSVVACNTVTYPTQTSKFFLKYLFVTLTVLWPQ